MKRLLPLSVAALLLISVSGTSVHSDNSAQKAGLRAAIADALGASDESKACHVYGKIKFVDSFADYEVKVVDHHEDLRVEYVDNFADEAGKWEVVDHHEDYKIEIVDHHEDFTIKEVDNFPGCD